MDTVTRGNTGRLDTVKKWDKVNTVTRWDIGTLNTISRWDKGILSAVTKWDKGFWIQLPDGVKCSDYNYQVEYRDSE